MAQAMPVVKVDAFQCNRCGHTWVPQNKDKHPKVCPRCKSPYWDTPRTRPPPKPLRGAR